MAQTLQEKLTKVEAALKNAELLFQQLLGQKSLLVELIAEEKESNEKESV